MMHEGVVTTSNPAPLPLDMQREEGKERTDRRATEAAIRDVRRREHSAD